MLTRGQDGEVRRVAPIGCLPQWPSPLLWADALSPRGGRAPGASSPLHPRELRHLLESIPGARAGGPAELLHGPITQVAALPRVCTPCSGPETFGAWVAATDGRQVWLYGLRAVDATRPSAPPAGSSTASKPQASKLLVVPVMLDMPPDLKSGERSSLAEGVLPPHSITSIQFTPDVMLADMDPVTKARKYT